MRIVYATNNKNGFLVLKKLIEKGFEIEYLILHPKENLKYSDEIIEISNVARDNVIYWDKRNIAFIKEKLKFKTSEILFSVNFAYKIPAEILTLFELPINLHTGYLPYNKGLYPNVWSIIDNTPAGVTIHRMTEKIDEGEIMFQEEVGVDTIDNAKTLYEKLEKKSIEIVDKYFEKIVNGDFDLKSNKGGNIHTKKDFKNICKINLERNYKAKDLLNILRALTFPPYKNAYFYDKNGNKVYLEIKLYKDESNNENNI